LSKGYRSRLWPLKLVVAIVCLAVATVGVLVFREKPAKPTVPYLGTSTPTTGVSLTPQPKSEPTKKYPALPKITQSPVLQVYIPNQNDKLVVSSPVHMLEKCSEGINPPLTGPYVDEVFACPEVEEPGTNAPSLTLLAGHSSEHQATAFNPLYRQGTELVGKEIWLKTKASKSHWLVYKVKTTYTPLKTDLPGLKEAWGTTRAETANRLLLITCLQNGDGTPSRHNFVAVAQLASVR